MGFWKKLRNGGTEKSSPHSSPLELGKDRSDERPKSPLYQRYSFDLIQKKNSHTPQEAANPKMKPLCTSALFKITEGMLSILLPQTKNPHNLTNVIRLQFIKTYLVNNENNIKIIYEQEKPLDALKAEISQKTLLLERIKHQLQRANFDANLKKLIADNHNIFKEPLCFFHISTKGTGKKGLVIIYPAKKEDKITYCYKQAESPLSHHNMRCFLETFGKICRGEITITSDELLIYQQEKEKRLSLPPGFEAPRPK